MKEVSYLLVLVVWLSLAKLLLCSTSYSSSSFSSPYSDSDSEIEQSSSTVDITSLECVSHLPYLVDLEGVKVQDGPTSHFESLKIVSKYFLPGLKFPNPLVIAFFEELLKLWKSDPVAFKIRKYGRLASGCVSHLVKHSVMNKEFELAKLLASYGYSKSYEIDAEIAEILSPYFLANPDKFLNVHSGGDLEFILTMELNEEQMIRLFQNNPRSAVLVLRKVCGYYRLISTEIKQKLLQIYKHLPEENKLEVEGLMYLRSLLRENDLKQPISVKYFSYSDLQFSNLHINAGLLGPFRDSVPLPCKTLRSFLFRVVKTLTDADPSILDWLIENVFDRTLNFRPHLLSAHSGRESRLTLERIKVVVPSLFKFRKIFAYVYSGHTNFLLSLATVDTETLREAENILANEGTAQEFKIFLSRADVTNISSLFDKFWRDPSIDDQFEECALLLLDCVDRIPPPEAIVNYAASRLLNYPAVLSRAIALGVPVQFRYRFLKENLLNDEKFLKLSPEMFRNAMPSRIDLKLFGPQIDRTLGMLQMTSSEYLQMYWRKVGVLPARLTVRKAIKIFSFLKRWKREYPEEVRESLSKDSGEFDEYLSEPQLALFFSEEARDLFKAHLLFGKQIISPIQIDEEL